VEIKEILALQKHLGNYCSCFVINFPCLYLVFPKMVMDGTSFEVQAFKIHSTELRQKRQSKTENLVLPIIKTKISRSIEELAISDAIRLRHKCFRKSSISFCIIGIAARHGKLLMIDNNDKLMVKDRSDSMTNSMKRSNHRAIMSDTLTTH